MYPEDVVLLSEEIKNRQLDEYIIQLRIATNPHLDPKEARTFAETLVSMKRQSKPIEDRPFDRTKFEQLRKTFGANRRKPKAGK